MKNIHSIIYLSLLLFIITTSVKAGNDADKATNIKTFGAKGDGVTDDYPALIKAADFINKNGGGALYFPKGNYYIGAYHTKGGTYTNIVFKNCNHLKITGDNAIISVKGDFNRTADYNSKGHAYSNINAIVPLSFSGCQNLDIEGLEVNGNADKMTRDLGVVESGSHLLRLDNCQNVIIKNLFLHHSQTDGIYITGNSSNVDGENITSSNNSRQGMSLIQLRDSKFINCKFINTGITEGKYGGDAPKAGIDIEPRSASGPVVTNITFQNCTFENNKGAQFVCGTPLTTSNITLTGCTVNAKTSTYKYQMTLAAKNVVLQSCNIDAGPGNIYPVWTGKKAGSNVTIKQCVIRSSSNGIIAVPKTDDDVVLIDHNQFIFTGDEAKYFPYLKITNLTFTNNTIMIPAKALTSKSMAMVQKAIVSSGNTFSTDNAAIKLKVSYEGTRLVKDN